jgi:hypothetical protein
VPDPREQLPEVLDRVVGGPPWTRWHPRRTVPALAALTGVVLLTLLGVAAPWTSRTVPVHGFVPPAEATRPASASPPPSPDPPPDRAHAAVVPPDTEEQAGVPPPPAGEDTEPAPPPAPPSLPALTSVRLSMTGGLTATMYAGQLEQVIRRLDGEVTFNTDPSFRAAYPRLCVATVVVTGASGTEGAVYAQGLGPGWGGAEGVPDLRVAADQGTLHQQLVIPPSSAQPGRSWTASASVHIDGSEVGVSGDYRLILDAATGSEWRWRVGNNDVTVACRPY